MRCSSRQTDSQMQHTVLVQFTVRNTQRHINFIYFYLNITVVLEDNYKSILVNTYTYIRVYRAYYVIVDMLLQRRVQTHDNTITYQRGNNQVFVITIYGNNMFIRQKVHVYVFLEYLGCANTYFTKADLYLKM